MASVLAELEALAAKGWLVEVLATSDKDGWTPLHIACRNASPAIIYCLLDAGADPKAVNGGDSTCLHFFCGRRFPPSPELDLLVPQLIAELLLRGCRLQAKNSNGENCLHTACSAINLAAVAFLLDFRVLDLSLPTKRGWTALDYALHQQSVPLCELLLKHRAPVAASSLELAQQLQSSEAIMAMLNAAAKKTSHRDIIVWDVQECEKRPLQLQGSYDLFRTTMFLKRFHVFVSNACKLFIVSANPQRTGEHLALLVESNSFTQRALQPCQMQLYQEAGVTDQAEQIRRLIWTLTPSLPEEEWRLSSSGAAQVAVCS